MVRIKPKLFIFPKLDYRMENKENKEVFGNEEKNNANDENSVTLSKEEYDKLRQTEEDYKASTKEAQRLRWIADVSVDNSKFLKLYETDKKMAKAVAEHFGRDVEELYEAVADSYGEKNGISKEDVAKQAKEIAEKTLAKQNLETFVKKYGIEGKLEKVFREEFEGLMENKTWTPEEVDKQCKRALRLVRDTEEFQKALEENGSKLAGAGATGNSRKGVTSTKSPYQQIKEEMKNWSLLSKYGKSKNF